MVIEYHDLVSYVLVKSSPSSQNRLRGGVWYLRGKAGQNKHQRGTMCLAVRI